MPTAGLPPMFFDSPAQFRTWLKKHHASQTELVVGLYKKASGRGGMTYAEALDEALCFGWIDGVRHSQGAESFTIRFTPRKKGSIWSLVNVRHVERLTAAGLMMPAGVKTFEARQAHKTGLYSFEKPAGDFSKGREGEFRRNKRAWTFWEAQPPGYRRTAIHWVESAKQEETRSRRLAKLIADSADGQRLALITGKPRDKAD